MKTQDEILERISPGTSTSARASKTNTWSTSTSPSSTAISEATMDKQKIICVDFDGVLHSYASGWQGADKVPDEPVPGALEWLDRLVQDKRFHVCIYSARSRYPSGLDAMSRWLEQHATNKYQAMRFAGLSFPKQKPAAFMTIDDRAFCFEGEFPDPDVIDRFVPWHKRSK